MYSTGGIFPGLPAQPNTLISSAFSTRLFTSTVTSTSTATVTATASAIATAAATTASTASSTATTTRTILTTATATSTITETVRRTRDIAASTARASGILFKVQPTPASIVNRMLGNSASDTISNFITASAQFQEALALLNLPPALADLIPVLKGMFTSRTVTGAVLGYGIVATGHHIYNRFRPVYRPTPPPMPPGEDVRSWRSKVKLVTFLLHKAAQNNNNLREALQEAEARNQTLRHDLRQERLHLEELRQGLRRDGTLRSPSGDSWVARSELQAWSNPTPADRETIRNIWDDKMEKRGLSDSTLRPLQQMAILGSVTSPTKRDVSEGESPLRGASTSFETAQEEDTVLESIEEDAMESAYNIVSALASDEQSARSLSRSLELHESSRYGSPHSAGKKRYAEEVSNDEQEEGSETPRPQQLSEKTLGKRRAQEESIEIGNDADEAHMSTPLANMMDLDWRAKNDTQADSTTQSADNSPPRSPTPTPAPKLDLGKVPKLEAPKASARPTKWVRMSEEPAEPTPSINDAPPTTRRRRTTSPRKASVPPTPARRSNRLANMEIGSMNLTELSRNSMSPGKASQKRGSQK